MARATAVKGLRPDTRLGRASRGLLAARLAEVRAQEKRVLRRLSPEAIHDMRVATRRLRAALRLLGGEGLAPLARRAKQLQDTLGDVRDLQVQVDWFAHHARGANLARGANRVVELEEQRLPDRSVRLERALSRWRETVAPDLEDAIDDGAELLTRGRLGGRRMRRRLQRGLKRVGERLSRAETLEADDVHALRIAVKKLRYQAELLSAGFPDAVTQLLELLGPLQEHLGALHDADVRLALLRGLLRGALADEKRAASRLLDQVVLQRARLARRLGGELRRWERHGLTRKLRRLLHED